ncbi:hypothetical protein [Devosia neptuniae]|uniref:hypothetical protein n=1 Tax=Devosia neptuniae TaxID=191302 RepID=UPI003F80EEC0
MKAIKSLLTRIDAAEDQVGESPAGAGDKEAGKPHSSDVESFDQALVIKTEAHDSIIAGSLELIGLDDIRNITGDAWPAIAATLLDSASGCAVHSGLPAGQGYTTLELKVAYPWPSHRLVDARSWRGERR